MTVLPLEYYQHTDVLHLSRDLLGKYLITKIGSTTTGGMIIETEAYRAPEDRASHAYNYRRTKRNEPMYQQGGTSYVYRCYGIHTLFNVVTNDLGVPHAILIRGIYPEIGIQDILKRRKKIKLDRTVGSGPGNVTQALGITSEHNGLLLTGPPIWIEDRGVIFDPKEVVVGPRVGVDYAGEDALLPWRFRVYRRGFGKEANSIHDRA